MPNLPQPPVLRRVAIPFIIALLTLTTVLIANYMVRDFSRLSAHGGSIGAMVEVMLLSVPFIVAMTLPMAVFIAVLWGFSRLRAEGAVDAVRRERHDTRRLLAPVLWAAVGAAALMLAWNAELLPRANARLVAVTTAGPSTPSDREMTLGELEAAAHDARVNTSPDAPRRAARYEVELQKKLSLAAACIVLALAGAAIGLLFPRGGIPLVIVTSFAVFGAYYFFLITGETLANRLVVSPFVAMWAPNALVLVAALLALWRRGARGTARGAAAGAAAGRHPDDGPRDAAHLAYASC